MDLLLTPPPLIWLALPALAALTGSFTFRIPGSVVRLTVAEPIVFTATLLYGPAAGTVSAAVDAVAMSLRMGRHLRTLHRFAFNVALLSLAIWPSSSAFFWMTQINPHTPRYQSLSVFLGPLYLFAAGVFLINSILLAVALGIERRTSALEIWRHQFAWVSISYFASASIAALLVVYGPSIDAALIAVLAPLLIVAYLVFRTTVGRLDDANRHLAEVNSLYLSTIETLAMAIDAKDQVTHGHIRRVQRFAVGLAKVLSVDDDRQLRAIEAAALLHDMGKLAIPEFILNKPGRLTAGEFSVMKTHAAVGADILSAIRFPYPVVPIVRHHHENWNGTGYPDGLKGVDIPIGARILSVVDCYDALTSDRPYRPAMSDAQALEILIQRRGTMYDPLIVDAFVAAHMALKSEVEHDVATTLLLSSTPEAQKSDPQIPPSQESDDVSGSLALLSALSPLVGGPHTKSICRDVIELLRQLTNFESAAVFEVDDSILGLRCIYSEGDLALRLLGLTIPMSEQLSGWVAAHRTAVWNSDASLDIGAGQNDAKYLASSMPLVSGTSTVAVLTLYSTTNQQISVAHRRTIESLLPSISRAVSTAIEHDFFGIDCRNEDVRLAVLNVLDSLLSHRRVSRDTEAAHAVLAVSLYPVPGDTTSISRPVEEKEIAALVSVFASRQGSGRIFIRLSDNHFLAYSEERDAKVRLSQDIARSKHIDELQQVIVDTLWIDTPQVLQDRVRHALDRRSASGTRRQGRVH